MAPAQFQAEDAARIRQGVAALSVCLSVLHIALRCTLVLPFFFYFFCPLPAGLLIWSQEKDFDKENRQNSQVEMGVPWRCSG